VTPSPPGGISGRARIDTSVTTASASGARLRWEIAIATATAIAAEPIRSDVPRSPSPAICTAVRTRNSSASRASPNRCQARLTMHLTLIHRTPVRHRSQERERFARAGDAVRSERR
jgi:hypothetical protein